MPSKISTLLNLYTPSKGVILNSELFTKEYDILFTVVVNLVSCHCKERFLERHLQQHQTASV